MASSVNAYLNIATANNQGLSNVSQYDINFYTRYQGQKIHIGTGSNKFPRLTFTSNNIGFSNTNPIVSLDINMTDAIRIPVGTTNQRPTNSNIGMLRYNTTINQYEAFSNNSWNSILVLNSSNNNNLVGILNSNPKYTLDVGGIVNVNGNLYVDGRIGVGNSNPLYDLDITGSLNISSNLYVDGRIGIGNSNPQYDLDITGSLNISSNLYVDGRIGIGNSNPRYELDINGNMNISSNLYLSSNLIIGDTSKLKNIVDNSSNNFPIIPVGNIPIVNNISPFVSVNESILLNYNSYIKIDNSQFNFNWWTTPTTIESWVYFNNTYGVFNGSYLNTSGFVGSMDPLGPSASWTFGCNSSGKIAFYYFTTAVQNIIGNTVVTLNTWHHIVMTFDTIDNKIRLWLDGILDNTPTTFVSTPSTPLSFICLGRWCNNYSLVNLYFTNLRISKSLVYNTNFTPSTVPLTTVSNTILLLQTSFPINYNTTIQGSLNTDAIYNLQANNYEDYEFPPYPMTANTTTFTNGETYTLTGSGIYANMAIYDYWKAFDKTLIDVNDSWIGASGRYTVSTGLTTGATSTTNIDGTSTYAGEYIQMQMPYSIILTKYKLQPRYSVGFQAPMKIRLLGSTNGTNWITIDERDNQYWHKNAPNKTYFNYNNINEIKTFYTNNTNAYQYYRLCINKIPDNTAPNAGNSDMAIGNIVFYGKKLFSTVQNIASNLNVIYTMDRYVGIGTTIPQGLLHIYNSSLDDTLILTNGGSNNDFNKPQIRFGFFDKGSTSTTSDSYGTTSTYGHFIGTRHNATVGQNNCIDFYCCTGSNINNMNFGSTLVMTLDGTGNVGIGITNPKYQLEISGTGKKLTSTSWATGSDKRLKTDIQTANYSKCYELLSNLDLKYFEWCQDFEVNKNLKDKHVLGWIADEVQKYIPKSVQINNDNRIGLSNLKTLDSDQIYANMYGTIKQLIKDKDILVEENNKIEKELLQLKQELSK